jgi:hypothetical protein
MRNQFDAMAAILRMLSGTAEQAATTVETAARTQIILRG